MLPPQTGFLSKEEHEQNKLRETAIFPGSSSHNSQQLSKERVTSKLRMELFMLPGSKNDLLPACPESRTGL